MKQQRFVSLFVVLSALFAAFFYSSFFINFATTLSDYSGFGVVWPHQIFHNFLHGRAFQDSLMAGSSGSNMGYIGNPYAFINTNAIHVHFTPFLFAYIWALHPTLSALYGLIFVWNIAGGIFFTWLIIKKLSPDDYRIKASVAIAVLLGSGLLSVLKTMAQPLLFAGPFCLAAYYCLLEKRRFLFFLNVVLLCMVSEDAAMVAAAFGAYIWFFEPESRSYAVDCLAFSVPYLLLVLFVVQPAARAELIVSEATTTLAIAKYMFRMTMPVFLDNLKSMIPVYTLLPAFFISGFMFGLPEARRLRAVAAMAILPALPHWGECVVVGGGHHTHPPFVFLYLALLLMIGWAPPAGKGWAARRVSAVTAAATAFFFLFSFRSVANNLPNSLRPPLYRLAGQPAKAEALERSMMVEEKSNRAVISAARSLPPEASLVFWTNNRVVGFLVARSAVWEFPEYFDQADYLLIQKDAIDLDYVINPAPWPALREMMKVVKKEDQRNVSMDPVLLKTVADALLYKEGTHKIADENEHILLLQRKTPYKFPSPPTTLGFGWTRNLFREARHGSLLENANDR